MMRSRTVTPYTVPLDPAAATPLFRQLYEKLRLAILEGRLPSGTRVPGTRSLARELGVSRTTILNAYEQLLSEGHLEGKIGSGTYVPVRLPDEMIVAAARRPHPAGAAA